MLQGTSTKLPQASRASSYAVAQEALHTTGKQHQKLAKVSPNYASSNSDDNGERKDYVKQMAVAVRMLNEVQSMIVKIMDNGPLHTAMANEEAKIEAKDANSGCIDAPKDPKASNVLKSGMAMIKMQSRLKMRAAAARQKLSRELQFMSASMRSGKDKIDIAKTIGEEVSITSNASGKQTVNITKASTGNHVIRKKSTMKRRLSVGTLQAVGDIQKQARTSRKTAIELAEELSQKHIERWNLCANTVIHPFNPLHTAWDCFVCFILLVVLWMLPLTLAFQEVYNATLVTNITIDIIFGIDLVKQFRTGFLTKDDVVIMDSKIIALTYLKGWFLVDLISILPIDAIITIVAVNSGITGSGQTLVSRSTRSLKMLRLLRIAKLLRLMRVSRAFRYIRFFKSILEDKLHVEIPSSIIKLLRLFTAVILVCHWGACLNYFVCRLYDFPPESWISEAGVQNMALTKKYGWCFLKAAGAVVKVGFGSNPLFSTSCDIATEWCEIETWMVFIQLFVGQVYYAILVAEISTILHNMDAAKRNYELRMSAANTFMRTKKLPSLLRDKIRDYMRARYVYFFPVSRCYWSSFMPPSDL